MTNPTMRQNEIYVGDNLNIMRHMSFKKYVGKISFIYIDPPYNTKTSKTYNDKHKEISWYDFMRSRLSVAKMMMRDDAVIFISIDDSEFANLKICCDEIFLRDNFVGTIITKQAQRSNAKLINTVHEYILCYAKNKKKVAKFSVKRIMIPEQKEMINKLSSEIMSVFRASGQKIATKALNRRIKEICRDEDITWLRNYSNVDERGRIYFAVDLSTPGTPREVNIPEINLHLQPLASRGWATDERFRQLHREGRLCFKGSRPYQIRYLDESEDNAPSIINFYSRQGTRDLKKLGLSDLFDTPKPVEMLKFLIRMAGVRDGIILDFFAGSGSTAQAVYELNDEDGRNNNYVLIQLDEPVNMKSRAYLKCIDFGIEPRIDNILEYRINRFLEINNKEIDYNLFRKEQDA